MRKSSNRYKGVYYHITRKKWVAKIWFNPSMIQIGYYNTELEAARAYDKKALDLFGDDAVLNLPEEN